MAAENPNLDANHEYKDFAIGIPLEQVVEADGTSSTVVRYVGTSEKAVADAVNHEIEVHGARHLTSAEKKTFGLSGSWNAPWNPKGPKKNWGYNPDTVRDN